MIRAAAMMLVALSSLTVQGTKERPPVDREKLEWFKKLSPEQKRVFRDRLEQVRKMPPEERQRLTENLRRWRSLPEDARRQIRERMQKMGPDERLQNAELAAGFFRSLGPANMRAFPRMAFFAWVQKERPGQIEKLRGAAPPRRKEVFAKLHGEFKKAWLDRLEENVRKHGGLQAERLEDLRKTEASEFWPKMMAAVREFRAQHPELGPGGRRPPGPPRREK